MDFMNPSSVSDSVLRSHQQTGTRGIRHAVWSLGPEDAEDVQPDSRAYRWKYGESKKSNSLDLEIQDSQEGIRKWNPTVHILGVSGLSHAYKNKLKMETSLGDTQVRDSRFRTQYTSPHKIEPHSIAFHDILHLALALVFRNLLYWGWEKVLTSCSPYILVIVHWYCFPQSCDSWRVPVLVTVLLLQSYQSYC